MHKFSDFLNESKVTLDKSQISDLARDLKAQVGSFKPETMDDVNDKLGDMGEDIPGFNSKDFTAVVKQYKTL